MQNLHTLPYRNLLWLAVALILFFVNLRSLSAPVASLPLSNDFAHYYITSYSWIAGHNPYLVDLGPEYEKLGLSNRPRIDRATNPPALIALFAPFSLLKVSHAYWIWLLVLVLSSLASIFIVMKTAGVRFTLTEYLCLSILLLSTFPFISNFEVAQVQPILLLLISIGLWLAQDSRQRYALLGMVLWGVASSLKLFTFPLIYVAMLYYGKKGIIAFCLGFALLHLPFLFSPQHALSFIHEALPQIQLLSTTFYANNSIPAALAHSFDALSVAMPIASSVLQYLSLFILMAILIADYLYRRNKDSLFKKAALCLVLICLLSPISWSHYLILLLPALFLIYAECYQKKLQELTELIILLLLFGLTQGRLISGELGWELVSIWWGPVMMLYLLFLLYSKNLRHKKDI